MDWHMNRTYFSLKGKFVFIFTIIDDKNRKKNDDQDHLHYIWSW